MITMKDVATHAGVSVSTVSNIVNGVKSVNSDIVKKVSHSMNELGYIPNAKAQGLRSRKSYTMGIVLPNLTDDIYSEFLLGVEGAARLAGYKLEIYTTGDFPELEIDVVNKLRTSGVEAVFITSCLPNDVDHINTLVNNGIKVIFFRRKPNIFVEGTYACADEYTAMYHYVETLAKEQHITRASLLTLHNKFSNEMSCIRAFTDACINYDIKILNTDYVALGKERAFKKASLWLQQSELPDVIITTNKLLADGVETSLDFFNPSSKPQLFYISNYSWTDSISQNTHISLDYNLLGQKACLKAIDSIDNPGSNVNETIMVDFKMPEPSPYKLITSSKKALKFLLPEGACATALQLLATKFSNMTGIPLEIETASYESLNLQSPTTYKNYDIIALTQSTLINDSEDQKILNLNDTIVPRLLNANYSNTVLDFYSRINGNYYAIPFMIDCQLLYYRKDLFENMHLQHLYYETYKTELVPPRSFKEYNQIAYFFSENVSDIPNIIHGVAVSLDYQSLSHEFILRFFELSNTKIPNSYPSDIIELVLINMCDLYHLSAKESCQTEQIEHINNGESCMGILNQASYMDYLENRFATSSENIYATQMPNGHSIQLGYSLAISSNTPNQSEAITFLKWFSSPEVTLANNLLGGMQASNHALDSHELSLVTPWLMQSYKNLERTVAFHHHSYHDEELAELLGGILVDYLNNHESLEDTSLKLTKILNS